MTRREQLEKNLELASVGHGIKDEFISVPLELQAHVWAELRALWAVMDVAPSDRIPGCGCVVPGLRFARCEFHAALDEYHGGQS